MPMRFMLVTGWLFLSALGWSQSMAPPFAPLEARWTVQEYTLQPHAAEGFPSFEVVIDKDTLIAGKSCRKMVKQQADTTVAGSAIYIHTDEDKVFFYENGQFRLFMDFSLEEGDTLTHYIPINQPLYAPDCCSAPDSIAAAQRVTNATYDTIDGQPLRQLSFEYISHGNDSTRQNWILGTIRERLGGVASVFGRGFICCLAGYPGHTRCYVDDDIMYEGDTIGCEITNVPGSINEHHTLTIFPNPGSKVVHVQSPETMKAILQGIDGKVVQTVELERGGNMLPVHDLPNGIYILAARSNENSYRQKLKISR